MPVHNDQQKRENALYISLRGDFGLLKRSFGSRPCFCHLNEAKVAQDSQMTYFDMEDGDYNQYGTILEYIAH